MCKECAHISPNINENTTAGYVLCSYRVNVYVCGKLVIVCEEVRWALLYTIEGKCSVFARAHMASTAVVRRR